MILDNHIKELIAIGASISANCHPCLEYHVNKAIENGAKQAEINEAIDVGKLVRRGAASNIDKFAIELSKASVLKEDPKEEGCGCGK